MPVIMVAGVRRLETIRDIITSGDADMVALSRALIRDPGLVARWQRGEVRPATGISGNQCLAISAGGEPLVCGEDRRLRGRAGRPVVRS